jgi:hypothetical protein
MKETEAVIDKMNKKLIELNNGLNDLDIDIKKALTSSGSDPESSL